MNASVGTAGSVSHHPVAEQLFHDTLELDLDRPPGRLPLPADEVGAVVLQRGEECPAHRPGI
jgi:hypothetical protein